MKSLVRKQYYAIVLLAMVVSSFESILAYVRDPITFGAVVRLQHKATGRYLTASDAPYQGGSKQPLVFAGLDGNTQNAYWIIKGTHNGDRWNFNLSSDPKLNSMIGWPLKRDMKLRLENVATNRNLRSNKVKSPITKQQEVANASLLGSDGKSNGIFDTFDNWIVCANDRAGGDNYLANGFMIKLQHEATKQNLSSSINTWLDASKTQQEVICSGKNNDNDWWIVQIINQPQETPQIKDLYTSSRSVPLSYWTPLFWDPESDVCYNFVGGHRVWVGASSLYDQNGTAVPPHDHMELILGPWSDPRAQRSPSFFVIHNADDKFKTGAIQYGDRLKIMVVSAAPGDADKAGLLQPFRYVWMHNFSRFNAPYRDLVVTRPEHSQTQGSEATFVFEPILNGQAGPISTNDIVRIKNMNESAYCWTNFGNRFKGQYWEIVATATQENDAGGLKNNGCDRRLFLEKYRFSIASQDSASNQDAKNDLTAITGIIQDILGKNALQQQVAALQAQNAQAAQASSALQAQLAAQQAEIARVQQVSDQKIAQIQSDASNQLASAKSDAAVQLSKAQADAAAQLAQAQTAAAAQLAQVQASAAEQLAQAQADAQAILDKVKSDDANALAQAQADAQALLAAAQQQANQMIADLQNQLEQEKELSAQSLQAQREAAAAAQQLAQENANKSITEEQAKALGLQDKIALYAQQLKNVTDIPIGFTKISGNAKSIAYGLQDFVTEFNNGDNKQKLTSYQDFGLIILADGSCAEEKKNETDLANSWQQALIQDERGIALKVSTAAVGHDGTVFVVSDDGKSLYGVRWDDTDQVVVPDPAKGFVAAKEKDAKRKKVAKHARHKKHKKNKKNKTQQKKHKFKQKPLTAADGRGVVHELS